MQYNQKKKLNKLGIQNGIENWSNVGLNKGNLSQNENIYKYVFFRNWP